MRSLRHPPVHIAPRIKDKYYEMSSRQGRRGHVEESSGSGSNDDGAQLMKGDEVMDNLRAHRSGSGKHSARGPRGVGARLVGGRVRVGFSSRSDKRGQKRQLLIDLL